MKEFSDLLAPFITLLFNKSLDSGQYPQNFKHAVVLPLLKKEYMDSTLLNNYRPVSNLPFVSKLLEKAVSERLRQHLEEIDGLPKHQSAYRRGHSTETALLKIVNDLLLSADRGEVSALCLLDLSAAFDTVDHQLLLTQLEGRFGVVGKALDWFQSYLHGRSYSVTYGSSSSNVVHLACSVPQGSVLGPLLSVLYTAELVDIAAEMGVNLHMYADDTQLYVHCKPSVTSDAVAKLEQCVDAVDKWMAASRLKMNSDKSEIIWVGTRHTVSEHPRPPIRIGNDTISSIDKVRLLGVLISADLTFDQHVTAVSGQCFHQLRQLRSVRQSLDAASITTLIHAFVSSRVDYCCSLLIGSPRSVTDKLQRVLNAAARVITNTSKYDTGLSNILHHDLHWLDVTERIRFRVAATVYQCLHGRAPAYLKELCLPIAASASRRGRLRSASSDDLVIPRYRLATYGSRAFSVAGPVCWNSLPDYLKSSDLSLDCFRHQLKTFLFCHY